MAGPTKDAAPSPWKTDLTHLSIRAPAASHWRAGRQWGRDATLAPKSDFSPRQAEMLLGDPKLVVAEVADPAAAPVTPPSSTAPAPAA